MTPRGRHRRRAGRPVGGQRIKVVVPEAAASGPAPLAMTVDGVALAQALAVAVVR